MQVSYRRQHITFSSAGILALGCPVRCTLPVRIILPVCFPKLTLRAGRWVEHDPLEIWQSVLVCLEKAVKAAKTKVGDIKVVAVGITNQRETTLVWDRTTGKSRQPPYLNFASPFPAAHPQGVSHSPAILLTCRQATAQCHRVDGPQDGRHLPALCRGFWVQGAPQSHVFLS